MLARGFVRAFNPVKTCACRIQNTVNNRTKSSANTGNNKLETPLGSMSSKFRAFEENDSDEILDVYEEKLKYSSLLDNEAEEEDNPLLGLNLERGQNGVFNIEDLVDVLKRENSEDIFVARLPPEIKYVDYICVVTGKSHRHMQAISQFVRRVYKLKRHKNDVVPKLEGKNSAEWMALDLGNIALHIFSKKSRGIYDLDSLWALGPRFDDECNKVEPVSEMLEKHSAYLEDLVPAS